MIHTITYIVCVCVCHINKMVYKPIIEKQSSEKIKDQKYNYNYRQYYTCKHIYTHTRPFYQGLISCFYMQSGNCTENGANLLVHPPSFRTGTSSCFLNTAEAVTVRFNNDLTHACLNIKPTSTMHHKV